MKKFSMSICIPLYLSLFLAFTLMTLHSPQATAADDKQNAQQTDVQADSYQFDQKTGWAEAEGNVSITYKGLVLEADKARLNMKTKDVKAEGDVYLYTLKGPNAPDIDKHIFWHGQKITGNFEDEFFKSGENKFITGKWYGRSKDFVHKKDGNIVFHNVQLSTCEYILENHDHYSMNAKKVVYTPKGKLKIHNIWYSVRNIPVFYWPYAKWDTDWDTGNIKIRIGQDDDWGTYVLGSRRWKVNENTDTTLQLDYRSQRGVAVGNLTERETENSKSEFLIYGMNDNDPPQTSPDYNRRFDIEDNRYRLSISHYQQFTDKLSLRLQANKLSDIDMLEDFFDDEHEDYRQPKSFIDLRYDARRFTASLSARPRLNDFYTAVESLPELRIDFPRQSVFDLEHLAYKGQTSLANLRMNWRDFDKPRPVAGLQYPKDYDAVRFDTLNMFYSPWTIADKLQITPRAGLRLTYYSDSSETPMNVNDITTLFQVDDPDKGSSTTPIKNYDAKGGSITRLAGELGLEVSTKFYKVWDNIENNFWGIDGLRHIVQPYANYTYIPEPSEDRENIYFFDRIDRLTEQNFVRAGLRQRLQTRSPSKDRIHTFVELDSYADFHIDDGDNDNKNYDSFVTEVKLNPKQKFSMNGNVIVNLDEGEINRSEITANIGSRDILQVGLSYLYRRDYESYFIHSMGSTLTDFTGETLSALDFSKTHYSSLSFDFPVGSKMQGYIQYNYDLEEGQFSNQIYQLTRDLHCWVGALRLEREMQRDGTDTTISLVLYLKAFPNVGFNTGEAKKL